MNGLKLWDEGGPILFLLIVMGLFIYTQMFHLFICLWKKKARAGSPSQPSSVDDTCMKWMDRRIVFLSVLLGCAPLLGILGTVSGMSFLFEGIRVHAASSSSLFAAGISQALITTQMGLLISAPGFVLLTLVKSQKRKLFIKHA